MEIDIKYLFDPPDLTKYVILTIQPLAPLSMVNSLPGSYYKTGYVPNKFMLCGLFENILNLHFSDEDRNVLRRKIKSYYKTKYKLDLELAKSTVGYKPILYHLFEVEPPFLIPDMIFYEDVWTQHLIGEDERHLKGVINNDWRVEKDIIKLKKSNNSSVSNTYFKNHRDQFPRYYRSPQQREFLITTGGYLIKIKMTSILFHLIKNAAEENNIGYLGTSEGWVNISIGETL